jgi:hypothetical protein
MTVAAGRARRPQADGIRPATIVTTRKPAVYSRPRTSDQMISPRAMSAGPTGVARTATYVFSYFNLKNTFVDS